MGGSCASIPCPAGGRAFFSNVRTACKPDSVPGLPPSMTIPLAPPLPTGSSCQPGFLGLRLPCGDIPKDQPARNPYSALLRVGLAVPVLLPVPRWALAPPFHPCPGPEGRWGGLFSVALSLGLPRPGVTRHPCLMESGLSSRPKGLAVIRPSARKRDYAAAPGASTGKRLARSAAKAASVASCGPLAQGRKRSRNARSSASGAACG